MLNSVLPAPWNDIDVGSVGVPGGATYSADSFTVSGSGQRIGGLTDAFNYAYQPDVGDADIEVHVDATKTSSTAKVGIMMRGDLSAGACFAAMLFSPSSGPMFQVRKFTGSKSKVWSFSGANNSSWLKLSRSGSSFSGYASSDGINWIPVGTINETLGSAAVVGLVVSSGTNSVLSQANFDSVVYNGGSIGLSSVSINSPSITGGSALQGAVTMNSPAPPQGAIVSLASTNPSVVSVPASVTVMAGSASATFSIATSPVQASTSASIAASYGGASTSAVVTLLPNSLIIFLSSITISPTSVVGGTSIQGTVTLNAAAPTGGAGVSLTSDTTSAATVPALLTIPAGLSSATFAVSTNPVAARATPNITAAWGTVSRSTSITVMPPIVSSLVLNPATVVSGGPSQGTVALSGPAPSGGAVVSISSSNTSAATAPASVTIGAGLTSATFTIPTGTVTSSTVIVLTATYGSVSSSASLTVQPPPAALSAVGLNPTSVTGGTSSQGTVTMNSPAPSGGAVISLSSSNTSAARVPSTVTIQSGATSATFTVATSSVTSATNVSITVTYNGANMTAALSVQPSQPVAALSALSVNPTSVTGGILCQATVTLSAVAPASGTTVNLMSSNTQAAGVPLTTTVQSGAATSSFTVTTSSVSIATTVTLTASYNGVNKTATLSVQPVPVSLSNITLNPTTVSGGTSSQGTVTLSGSAPSGGITVGLSSSNTSAASAPTNVSVQSGASSATFSVTTNPVSTAVGATITASYNSVSLSDTLTVNPTGTSVTGNFWVSPSGSDSNPGTQAQPFLTIKKGITSMTGGQTLIIRGGTYVEQIVFYQIPAGSSWTGLTTIRGYPGEAVILKPNSGPTVYRVIDMTNSPTTSYVSFENLILDGTNVSYDCVKVDNGSNHIQLLNCELKNAPNQGLLGAGSPCDDCRFINLNVHNNGRGGLEHGFYLNSNRNLIDGCWVHDCTGYGIQLNETTASGSIIRNNRIERCLNGGMFISGSNQQVYNNVVRTSVFNPQITTLGGYGGADGIRLGNAPNCLVYNNTIVGFATNTGCLNWSCNGQGSSIDIITSTVTGYTVYIYNNIGLRNDGNGISNSDPTITVVGKNNFLSGISDAHASSIYVGNILSRVDTDARFAQVWATDYTTEPNFAEDLHLLSTSPCIGAGTSEVSTVLTTDKDGKPRPQASGWDIGAYQHVP